MPIRRSQGGTFRPPAQPKAHESGRGEGRYQAEARLLLAARHHPPHQRGYKRRWRQEPNSAPATASPCCFCALPPAMASLKDLEGKWRLLESHGFEEYMKELGETLSPNPSLGPHPCGGCVGSLHHAAGEVALSTMTWLEWRARLCRGLRTWWVARLLSFLLLLAPKAAPPPPLLPVLHRCVPAVLL